MTFSTPLICANLVSARPASSVTFSPILFRYLKQPAIVFSGEQMVRNNRCEETCNQHSTGFGRRRHAARHVPPRGAPSPRELLEPRALIHLPEVLRVKRDEDGSSFVPVWVPIMDGGLLSPECYT